MAMTESALESCKAFARAAFPSGDERRARDVAFYLAHVGAGLPMRELARACGRQPSTVMRAIRRIETLRDDPLVERTLDTLEAEAFSLSRRSQELDKPMQISTSRPTRRIARLAPSERTALERLSEPGAFLLVAGGAERAGVFSARNDFRKPVALIAVDAASRFLTADWVRCTDQTPLTARYVMTATGRAMLRRRELAEAPNPNPGFAEAPSVFTGQHQLAGERRVANPVTGEIETIRVNLGESPLGWLARRKDAKGVGLLTPEEVEAGERLREDFEMAQIGPKIAQDWSRFLAPVDGPSGPGRIPSEGPMFARERFGKAAAALGPGLADAAIRICCFHEGLEATERRMGWSARSAKVVLKLALQRLVEHYGLARRAA